MHNIYLKFRKFITQDVKNESESKDLAVLLRTLSIVSVFYLVGVSIYFGHISQYGLSIISFLSTCFYLGSFMETYENKTVIGKTMFNYNTLVLSIVLTLATGWSKQFEWMMFIPIFIIFFGTDTELKKKQHKSQIIISLCITLSVITNIIQKYDTGSSVPNLILSIMSTIYYSLSFGLIAYCFSKKYNETENKLHKFNQKLMSLANFDPLTGLSNRRYMNEYLNDLCQIKDKNRDVFSLALLDLDYFKSVNDEYGHEAGDYILKEVSKIFTDTMESRGRVARWGGEEFLFCFENLNPKQAYNVMDSMREEIEKKEFVYNENKIKITITAGIEEYYHIAGIEGTISKADKKLYKGKEDGRNRIVN